MAQKKQYPSVLTISPIIGMKPQQYIFESDLQVVIEEGDISKNDKKNE